VFSDEDWLVAYLCRESIRKPERNRMEHAKERARGATWFTFFVATKFLVGTIKLLVTTTVLSVTRIRKKYRNNVPVPD